MERVGGHPGACQPLGQLGGEQDVGQLGSSVDLHLVIRVFGHQVVEDHAFAGEIVSSRSHVDDTGRSRLDQPLLQQLGEEERSEVVDGERGLVAVCTQRAVRQDQSGIVQQDVDPRAPLEQVGRPGPYRGEVGEVEERELDLV